MKGRILVTGGTGYIGSHTAVELQNAGYEVVIIDNLSNSNIEVLDGIERITGKRPEFVNADCTEINALERLFIKYSGHRVGRSLPMVVKPDRLPCESGMVVRIECNPLFQHIHLPTRS